MRTFFSALFSTVVALLLLTALLKTGVVKINSTVESAPKESTYNRVIRTGTIHCGYSVWNPLMWVDPNSGEKRGIFPDLIEEAGKRLHLKIEWQEELGWGTVVEAVQSGRVDMACAGYWLQPNRYKFTASTTPLFYAPLYVWGRDEDNGFTKKMEDLNSEKVTIGQIDGAASNQIAAQRFPKAKSLSLTEMSTNIDLIESLLSRKIDFVIDDATTLSDYIKKNPNKIRNLFPDQPVAVFPVVMLLPPEDPHFKQMIDDALKSMAYDGTLDVILKKYQMDKSFMRNPPLVK